MKRGDVMLVVLPTAEIMAEPQETTDLLGKIDLPLQVLASYTMNQWARIESDYSLLLGQPSLSTCEQIATLAKNDFLENAEYQRLLPSDRTNLVRMIEKFIWDFYHEIICPVIEPMNFSTYQLQTLCVKTWAGSAMVIDVPNS